MRNRRPLTSLVALVGIVTLVGCASPTLQYANSHGYYPARINGGYSKTYYCSPRPWISGSNSNTTVACLTFADIEDVRKGEKTPPSATPEAISDLPRGFQRVIIDDQQVFCWRTYAKVENVWSCNVSLAVAQALQARYPSQISGSSGDSGYSAFGPSLGIYGSSHD